MRTVIAINDRPFTPPLDIELDLPVPPSVNKTRRVDWSQRGLRKTWQKAADAMLLAARGRSVNPLRGLRMLAQFEAIVILSEKHTKLDLDNAIKELLDWCKRAELIVDDGPKYLRRLVIEWGYAPHGCRIILRPREPN